jgi:hypothetical protein
MDFGGLQAKMPHQLPRRFNIMAFRNHPDPLPSVALNAIALVTPPEPLPVVIVPYERDQLHAFLDRNPHDVYATRLDERRMAVVPLTEDAQLPGPLQFIEAQTQIRLFSSLAREAVFRHLKAIPGDYRITRRRPPTVESVKQKNIVPDAAGLPDWMQKRRTLVFETRTLSSNERPDYVALTCAERFRPVIDRNCADLSANNVTLLGRYVSTWAPSQDQQLADQLQLAGRVRGIDGDHLLLDDYGSGPDRVRSEEAFLEPSLRNFRAVVEALKLDSSERSLRLIQQAEGALREGKRQLEDIQKALLWLSRQNLCVAFGVPLKFGDVLAQGSNRVFPFVEVFDKAKLSFDPSGSGIMSWPQGGLDRHGPYDSSSFEKKRPRIAVICEARERGNMSGAIADFLNGVPDAQSRNGLKPHETGLIGRYKLQRAQVEFFESNSDSSADYTAAAREALAAAAESDQPWDLAIIQVRRQWKERLPGDSPYWAAKAAFLKRDVPVQAFSAEMLDMGQFEYACALANASLASYAKIGGTPWLLQTRPSTDHELLFGLGSHTRKDGRRGAGERVVGITTVFSSQGHYLLDARTGAVAFDDYPAALRTMLVEAIERVRKDEAWRASDAVRLVFHAFIQMRRETADAVMDAVEGLGLSRVSVAFLHVAEDHPFTVFDQAMEKGRGAYGPKRGQAVELSNHEWLVSMTGREQINAQFQGLPDPVLLRLHERSTFRDMRTLAKQVSDFGCHSWRTFGNARVPITLQYADEIAKQLAGLEMTPGWDSGDAAVSRVMRRPWFL